MGKELFDRFPAQTAQTDAILGYSIAELCLEDPHGRLSETQYTQPSRRYMSSTRCPIYLARPTRADPGHLLGHSLGELNALWAAGAFDFETGVALVKRRGELVAEVRDGGMAAVLIFDKDRIADILQLNAIDTLDFANFNSRGPWSPARLDGRYVRSQRAVGALPAGGVITRLRSRSTE
jgi:malonyl CoA-acyl carrier protein transacylase